ncbi:putative disease resistance protein RGA4 [Morus notabilis]|uniref:putative disease resistance protein RGA4 n=1 Tax=Morus notabilis TaxID=981085 RepID=UPI000CED79E4|nr:putative disease resistance protein RGA4 [Morus notabilis]
MTNKIKQIRETLDEIKANQVFSQLDKCEHGETRTVSSTMSWRETHSLVIDDEVIGRENDKKEILDFLLDNNIETKESVSIVSLVGFGGLGKTTLAQFVFNDELVKNRFEKQMYWVCVSDSFDLRSLLEKILRSATEKRPNLETLNLEQLQTEVRKEIEGKRYLLVLDDVWNENSDLWEKLETFLKLGAQGSKVLITTRSIRVAEIVHSTKTYMLSGLDKDKSRALFERVAFRGINKSNSQYHGLVEVGRDIVDKCKGVPLAIKTIGRLLESKIHSSQNAEKEWVRFRDNELAKVAFQNDSDIVPTLKLSYNSLPSHLKHCFAYCSLFPKDYRINVQELIEIWIAQGFIISDSTRQLEDIGYEYFMILFWGCFFQEAETGELSPTTIKYCKMHDLMHDLASLVAGKSIQIFDVNTSNMELVENAFEKVCHISLGFADNNSSCQIPKLLFEQKKMRTFILRDAESLSSSCRDDVVSNFTLLRALSLHGIKTLPKSFGKLDHLRFLDLSFSRIVELPSSITELYYLQTLILCQCKSLVSLPANLQNLINLRRLEIFGCEKLTHMPRGIGELSSLQSLDTFIVANNKSSESAAGFDELSKLNNLHGGLTIEIRGLGESKAAKCLTDKEHLESLKLDWVVKESMGNAEETFGRLEPPQNIKAIKVHGYPGETFPVNWFSSLTDLVRLELFNCRNCKYLPPLHHLSSLKELRLDALSALEYVSEKDNHDWSRGDQPEPLFPSLVKLNLLRCGNLQGWWRGETEDFCEALTPHQQLSFPKLSIVEISYCPLLNSMPPFPNLEKLSLYETSSKPLERISRMKLKVYDSVEETFSASSSSIPSSSPSALSKLKHLSINYVNDLESLLSEAQIHNLALLQYLEIESCSKLTLIPNGIGSLSSLTSFEISRCSNLTSIPNEMASLSSLIHLEISGCSDLTSIPNEMASLSSLIHLEISGCSDLTSIPNEMASLSSLRDLTIEGCSNLKSIPNEIGSLSSLTHLEISGCSNLTSIPNEIGSLSSLTSLVIGGCSNLTSIPKEIGSLSSLRDLIISGCRNLTSIPKEIGSLSSLRDLIISGCSNLTSIPKEIGSLSSLRDLIISGCSNLTSIPKEIGSLSSLRDLTIEGCSNLTSIPNEIGSLSSLTHLGIYGCSNLPSIPNEIGSLSSLTHLGIYGCSNLPSIPNEIGSLSSLTHLGIYGCSNLPSIPNEIGSLSSLTHLGIYGCSNLPSIPNEIGSLSSLTHLGIYGCSNLPSIPNEIGSLSSLTHLGIYGCSNLPSIPNEIGSLSSLTHLGIYGCSNLPSIPNEIGSLSSLTHLGIYGCSNLPSIPNEIGSLSSLTHLGIYGCSNLPSIPNEIGSLSSLTHLGIYGCSNLPSIPNEIGSLSSLTHLGIYGCSNLPSIPNEIGSLSSLTHLGIYGCSNLPSIPNEIGSLSSLTHLGIYGCSNLPSIPNEIGSLSSLTRLDIYGCSKLTSIPNEIGSLSSLIHLGIYGCSNLTSIPNEIGSLSSLRSLEISRCRNLTSIPNEIGRLSSLTSLKISGCSNLTSIPNEIGSLSSLIHLGIYGCSNLPSIPNEIGSLSSLIHLGIYGCSNLPSIPNEIGSLSSLIHLGIYGSICPQFLMR